jgi:hypothetical protein
MRKSRHPTFTKEVVMTTRFPRCALPLLLVLAPLASHCAPQNAEAIRKDKSLTLGLPGLSYRPTGKFAVGSTFSSLSGQKNTVKVDNSTSSGVIGATGETKAPTSRVVTTSETVISPFVQYFPWSTSAFFVGAGGSYYTAKMKYDEDRMGSPNLEPSLTSVAYSRNSTYVGVPFGWAWIWTPGFSLTVDLEPQWRVATSDKYKDDGTSDQVNTDNRDRTVKAIDGLETAMNTTLGFLIGWSF